MQVKKEKDPMLVNIGTDQKAEYAQVSEGRLERHHHRMDSSFTLNAKVTEKLKSYILGKIRDMKEH